MLLTQRDLGCLAHASFLTHFRADSLTGHAAMQSSLPLGHTPDALYVPACDLHQDAHDLHAMLAGDTCCIGLALHGATQLADLLGGCAAWDIASSRMAG